MEPINWRGPPPPPDKYSLDFQAKVDTNVKSMKSHPSKFVKKMVKMPKVSLPPTSTRRKASTLANQGLIG
jgi:hypothetical protein